MLYCARRLENRMDESLYKSQDESPMTLSAVDQLRSELDAARSDTAKALVMAAEAKLREQAALLRASRARESAGAMAEQLQNATKQNSELNLQLTIMTNDAIEWESKAEEAEARIAEQERDEARAQAARLATCLQNLGRDAHMGDCNAALHDFNFPNEYPCDCGVDAALSAVDQLRAELDAAKAIILQGTESAWTFQKRAEAAEARIAELLKPITADGLASAASISRDEFYRLLLAVREAEARANIADDLCQHAQERAGEWQGMAFTAEARAAELERELAEWKSAAHGQMDMTMKIQRERDEAQAHAARLAACVQSWVDLDSTTLFSDVQTIISASPADSLRHYQELEAHATRLAVLMQEATDNCETCRGETDGCARCASFRLAISTTPAPPSRSRGQNP